MDQRQQNLLSQERWPARAAKVSNARFLPHIWPEVEKLFRKNQKGFRENQSTTSQILTILWNIEGVCAKNLEVTLLFRDCFKTFHYLHGEKMEQIHLHHICLYSADGNKIRLSYAVLNKSWKKYPTKQQQYGHLPPISQTIKIKRTRYAGHC